MQLVSERAPALGIEVFEIDIRDVMLRPDVKAAFAEVLRARAEGRAALERARGESAALRNLANAARLLDSNPALMNLRLLQTIAQDAGVPGSTRFVVNLPESIAGPAGKRGGRRLATLPRGRAVVLGAVGPDPILPPPSPVMACDEHSA
jgi:hypothetical protein